MYIDTINVSHGGLCCHGYQTKIQRNHIEDHGNFIEFLLELFLFLKLKLANGFSVKWKKYNIFSALLRLWFDLPFSA
jgi:hypothetical protein